MINLHFPTFTVSFALISGFMFGFEYTETETEDGSIGAVIVDFTVLRAIIYLTGRMEEEE